MSSTTQPQAALGRIADHLAKAAGTDPRTLDSARLEWIIKARCRILNINEISSYADQLDVSAEELERLIDEVVIGETRFFRDPAVFEHLRRWLPELTEQLTGKIRVLSAPCSTGQEAYSIAATFAMAGIALTRVHIDAFDISAAALNVARRGQFPAAALDKLSPEQQNACGLFDDDGWAMHDSLRNVIHFERRNLAQPGVLANEEPYHLILCRNLFIYLKPEARAALAQSLQQALTPGGRLILGSADRVEEISALFSPLKPAASFAYSHRVMSVPTLEQEPLPLARPKLQVALKPRAAATPAAELPVLPQPTTAEGLYRRALEHRDHGELRRAERRCRQALYLDPQYLPALELLERLWSQHPNPRLRLALQARIQRHRSGVEQLGAQRSPWTENA